MKHLAQWVSVIFHPIFTYWMVILLAYSLWPYVYSFEGPKAVPLAIIKSFFIVVLLPVVAIFMMKKLNLVDSLKMTTSQQRIGPMIAIITFYVWYFVNVRNNHEYPPHHVALALGAAIGAAVAFFINTFFKISLHTLAAGSAVSFLLWLIFYYDIQQFIIPIQEDYWIISTGLVLMIVIFLAGLIGTARLWLGAHRQREIWVGYMVGIFSQLLAFRMIMLG